MSTPALSVAEPPRGVPVRGIALVMHGGRSTSTAPVRARQLAVLRMLPFAKALQRTGGPDGLVVARLRYAVRGWNGATRSPVADATWALEQLIEQFPGVPVALVGHSMGGRTAFYVAGHRAVTAVVALAPWIERGDPVRQLRGKRVLIAHGTQDRMTSARGSEAYASLAEAAGAVVTYVSVRMDAHAMLRRAELWHRLTAGFVTGVLFGTDNGAEGTAGPDATNPVNEALAGERSLVV